MTIRGRDRPGWLGVVLNAPDARALATFCRDLLGWPLATDEPDWCTMQMPDLPVNLAFQTEADYVPPVWPVASGRCVSSSTPPAIPSAPISTADRHGGEAQDPSAEEPHHDEQDRDAE